jgi:hypothetical protein
MGLPARVTGWDLRGVNLDAIQPLLRIDQNDPELWIYRLDLDA